MHKAFGIFSDKIKPDSLCKPKWPMAGASRGLKENTESQFIKNKRIKRSIYKRGITTAEECPHHFGYLSQRPRHVELPEGCMTCVKLLECMTFEPNVETVTHQMKEAYDIPLKNKASTRKTRSKVSKQHEKTARKTEKKEPLKTLNNESETLPPRQELSECQLKVETLSIWDSLWSDTVRIDKEVLSRWGQKIELVEVEASDGENIRMIRCQVKPMESADKGVIQIPIRIQRALKIRKGEPVTVKPASN